MAKKITTKKLNDAIIKAVIEKVVNAMKADEVDSKLCYTDGGRFCLMLTEEQMNVLRVFVKVK